ncbi:hypothetical protein [Aestuariicoccus sp. MJ-SS9]|uniref:hypothetical protein n=1 Tax=Aestuariicoccus sp. MJ-SS9 TaxID=3079855 RepID=UPI0029158606|nr:hypothetical protein [Aestuariicoccus sp. MJ-SS9]MDU8914149.1 hypothetical protein [Aestuariicoccus sp. MJ-SS9]
MTAREKADERFHLNTTNAGAAPAPIQRNSLYLSDKPVNLSQPRDNLLGLVSLVRWTVASCRQNRQNFRDSL